MSIGDRFKLTLNSQSGSTPMQNVFHYRQTLGVTGGNILAEEFINEVFPHIVSILSNTTVWQSVDWINYDDLADFGTNDSILGTVGDKAGNSMPRFNAVSFIYHRDTRATRNGAKRFSVYSEDDQNGGTPDPDFLIALQAAAEGLEQFINLGVTEIWRPIIARLSSDGSSIVLVNDVESVTFNRLTTQNSRKPF